MPAEVIARIHALACQQGVTGPFSDRAGNPLVDPADDASNADDESYHPDDNLDDNLDDEGLLDDAPDEPDGPIAGVYDDNNNYTR